MCRHWLDVCAFSTLYALLPICSGVQLHHQQGRFGCLVHSVWSVAAQEYTTCNNIASKALSVLGCPHLLHFDGPEFKLGVSVTPQCGHREVPAWLERLIKFIGPVTLTLSLQGWAGHVGEVRRWRKGGTCMRMLTQT